jgi:hypothetical protein
MKNKESAHSVLKLVKELKLSGRFPENELYEKSLE